MLRRSKYQKRVGGAIVPIAAVASPAAEKRQEVQQEKKIEAEEKDKRKKLFIAWEKFGGK